MLTSWPLPFGFYEVEQAVVWSSLMCVGHFGSAELRQYVSADRCPDGAVPFPPFSIGQPSASFLECVEKAYEAGQMARCYDAVPTVEAIQE